MRLYGQAGYPPSKRVTSPTWGPQSLCKQALEDWKGSDRKSKARGVKTKATADHSS